MSEVTGKQSTGGADHFKVTGKTLDLLNYTKDCEKDQESDPDSPNCESTLYLAERNDRKVHSAHVKKGNVEETRVRSNGSDANDSFWIEAQQKMGAAYRIYTSLIGGLGTALGNGSYDPTRRTFKNGDQSVAVRCRAENSGTIVELTLAYPKYDIVMDITDRADLATFDGKLKCDQSDRP